MNPSNIEALLGVLASACQCWCTEGHASEAATEVAIMRSVSFGHEVKEVANWFPAEDLRDSVDAAVAAYLQLPWLYTAHSRPISRSPIELQVYK